MERVTKKKYRCPFGPVPSRRFWQPTLHSGFGEVLAFIRAKSTIPAVLLTNGTMLYLPEVREAAAQANVVKVFLSFWDEGS